MEQLWFGDADDTAARDRAAQSVAGLAGAFEGLRPFPHAARRLLDALGRDDVDAVELERIIETDPGLACRVLRVVNSASFGLRAPCASIRHATVLLGFKAIGDMAASLAVIDAVDDGTPEVAAMLEHMRLVAVVAQRIAGLRDALRDLPVFTVGLLHDLGKLMQLQVGAPGYLDLIGDGGTPPYVREREALGYDHALLGAVLLERWQVPDPIPRAVGWHHQPARAYADPSPELGQLVAVTRLANRVVHAFTATDWPDDDTLAAITGDEAATLLELDESDCVELFAQVPQILINERLPSAA